MKNILILIAVTSLVVTVAWSAPEEQKRERPTSGTGGANAGGGQGGRGFGMFGLPGQLSEKLNLTEEQKQKAATIKQKYEPQLMELRKKMMEEFRGVLTEEQKKHFDEAFEQVRQRMQGREGASGGRAQRSERKAGGTAPAGGGTTGGSELQKQ